MDDLSPDETRVAHHCDDDRDHLHIITLNGSQISASTDVYFPKELLGVAQIWGSARFNGSGTQVAYALALGNPEAEQSWVAVSVNENLNGNTDSKVIATSEVGSYFTVLGWLNADTLLLQSYGEAPRVWSVSVSSGALTQLAEGEFLAMVR